MANSKYYIQQKIICLKFNGSWIASFLAMTHCMPRHCEERSNLEAIEFHVHNRLLYIISNFFMFFPDSIMCLD